MACMMNIAHCFLRVLLKSFKLSLDAAVCSAKVSQRSNRPIRGSHFRAELADSLEKLELYDALVGGRVFTLLVESQLCESSRDIRQGLQIYGTYVRVAWRRILG